MRILILYTSLIFYSLTAFSQDEVFGYYTRPPGDYTLSKAIKVNPIHDYSSYEPMKMKAAGLLKEEIMGSPYYLNYWHKGQFQLSGGKYMEAYLIFDIYNNTILISKDGEKTDYHLSPEKFKIKNQLFSKYNHQYQNAGNYFYQRIKHPHLIILKNYSCKYTDYMKTGSNGYDKIYSNSYEGGYEKDQHFYLVVNNHLSRISPKKSFYKLFKKNGQTIRKFVEKENLDLTFKKDVLRLADKIAGL